MKMSPREAICQYMGWEYSEASDYRYQYGRSAIPVYSTSDGLVCATANGKKPPKADSTGWVYAWKEVTTGNAVWIKNLGYTVWESAGEEE